MIYRRFEFEDRPTTISKGPGAYLTGFRRHVDTHDASSNFLPRLERVMSLGDTSNNSPKSLMDMVSVSCCNYPFITEASEKHNDESLSKELTERYVEESSAGNKSTHLAPKKARKGREKTEFCRFFLKGIECPYKDMCSYAHGPEELQRSCIGDFVQSIEEANEFRCRPCQTWIATGACPFKSRCSFLHDPRVSGSTDSWLPIKDMPSNRLPMICKPNDSFGYSKNQYLNRNVLMIDTFHNIQTELVNKGNPFGTPCWEFATLYSAACNLNIKNLKSIINQVVPDPSSVVHQRLKFILSIASRNNCSNYLNEQNRLEIALSMRGKATNLQGYEFWPTHVLYGKEGCMILQKKAFWIVSSTEIKQSQQFSVLQIPLSEVGHYERLHQIVVLVHELAFGPEMKKNTLPTSLWFNLSEGYDLEECSHFESKRLADEVKARNRTSANLNKKKESDGEENQLLFTTATPFFQVRAQDKSAFLLVTQMIQHRLYDVRRIDKVPDKNGYGVTSNRGMIDEEYFTDEHLLSAFHASRKYWNDWYLWPERKGHVSPKNMDCDVVSEVGIYEVPEFCSRHLKRRWDAFVEQIGIDNTSNNKTDKTGGGIVKARDGRLKVLVSIA